MEKLWKLFQRPVCQCDGYNNELKTQKAKLPWAKVMAAQKADSGWFKIITINNSPAARPQCPGKSCLSQSQVSLLKSLSGSQYPAQSAIKNAPRGEDRLPRPQGPSKVSRDKIEFQNGSSTPLNIRAGKLECRSACKGVSRACRTDSSQPPSQILGGGQAVGSYATI